MTAPALPGPARPASAEAALAGRPGVAALFQPTVLLALALMAVIVMMVLPVPAFLLDIGLAASFALAILILTVTLFIQRPLDFSAFPTVLLASLMLRLSLNVASTKLIIGEGHTGTAAAGHVIESFASFIMGGSVFLGLVIFTAILIVNFIVITRGAGRMAEVGARFALDAMPGKQLAIDADVAAGAIGHEEARERRRLEQEETNFFGSLDGASKFVKGDAVAGLLITLINLLVGLAMGIVVHGMAAAEALETYAILTVGDGLVTQIPAVIISVAAALLLAKGGAAGPADRALLAQLGRHPAALGTVAGLLALFALVPGLPTIPFLAGALILGLAARAAVLRTRRAAAEATRVRAAAAAADPAAAGPARRLGDILDLDEIHVEFAQDLVPLVMDEATGLDGRILNMRNHIAQGYGLVIPEIRLTDSALLPESTYVIRLQGAECARGRLEPGRLLCLLGGEGAALAPPGTDAAEPVYGAPARWIRPEDQEAAVLAGLSVVAPVEVVATHLMEVLKDGLGRLLNRRVLRRLLDEFVRVSDPARAEANRRLLDEFVPDRVPLELLGQVLRLLLEERVSVRNLPLILEAIAEARGAATPPEAIAEHVRQRLGFQIVAALAEPDGTLPVLQLGPDWEELFRAHETVPGDGPPEVALPPAEFARLARAVAERLARAAEAGRFPALAVPARRRRLLRGILAARGLRNPVLAFEEIGPGARPAIIGLV